MRKQGSSTVHTLKVATRSRSCSALHWTIHSALTRAGLIVRGLHWGRRFQDNRGNGCRGQACEALRFKSCVACSVPLLQTRRQSGCAVRDSHGWHVPSNGLRTPAGTGGRWRGRDRYWYGTLGITGGHGAHTLSTQCEQPGESEAKGSCSRR